MLLEVETKGAEKQCCLSAETKHQVRSIVSVAVPGTINERMKNFASFIRKWFENLKEWIKPDPADNVFVQTGKLFFKCMALLVMLAFSPVLLVVLVFVFFAAI